MRKDSNRFTLALIVAIYVAAVILCILFTTGVKSQPVTFVQVDQAMDPLRCTTISLVYSGSHVVQVVAKNCVSDVIFRNGFGP